MSAALSSCHLLLDDLIAEQAAVLALNKANDVFPIADRDLFALLGDPLGDFELLGLFNDGYRALRLVRDVVKHVLGME